MVPETRSKRTDWRIDPRDVWRLRVAHGRRQREVVALAQRWLGATG